MKPTPLSSINDVASACFVRGLLLGMVLGALAALAGIAASLVF